MATPSLKAKLRGKTIAYKQKEPNNIPTLGTKPKDLVPPIHRLMTFAFAHSAECNFNHM